MADSPRWPLGAGVALLLAAELLTGCAPAPATGTPLSAPETPAASALPRGDPKSDQVVVPIYFVGETPAGFRLYREFRAVPAGDIAGDAVNRLFGPGLADNRRTLWAFGWGLREVQHANGVITVDLITPEHSGLDTPPTPPPEFARLAVQQIVYTAQDALHTTDPVRILLDEHPADSLWGQVPIDAPIGRADPYATRCPVQIDYPVTGSVLGRTTRVFGEASVSEAKLTWQILSGQTVVRSGSATTGAASKFSPYSFEVTLDPGKYTLRVAEDHPPLGEIRQPFSDSRAITVE